MLCTVEHKLSFYPVFLPQFQALLAGKLTFGDVKVEEVAIEDGLDHAGHDGDQVEEALEEVTPEPVEDVEGAVHAQAEQVVGGDGLRLAGLGDHEELRQDCHRLQVDGEGPQDLQADALELVAVLRRARAVKRWTVSLKTSTSSII